MRRLLPTACLVALALASDFDLSLLTPRHEPPAQDAQDDDSIPSALVSLNVPTVSVGSHNQITFRLDVDEGQSACGVADTNLLINGQKLHLDEAGTGRGTFATDQGNTVTANWDFTCVEWDGAPQEQLFRLGVDYVDGHALDDTEFTLRFQQTAPVWISTIDGSASMTRIYQSSNPESQGKQSQLESELAELASLKEQIADLEQMIAIKEQQVVTAFGLEMKKGFHQCDSIKCVLQVAYDHVHEAAMNIYANWKEDPHHGHPHHGHHPHHPHQTDKGNGTRSHPPFRPPPFCHCPPHPPHDGPPDGRPPHDGPHHPPHHRPPPHDGPPRPPKGPDEPDHPPTPRPHPPPGPPGEERPSDDEPPKAHEQNVLDGPGSQEATSPPPPPPHKPNEPPPLPPNHDEPHHGHRGGYKEGHHGGPPGPDFNDPALFPLKISAVIMVSALLLVTLHFRSRCAAPMTNSRIRRHRRREASRARLRGLASRMAFWRSRTEDVDPSEEEGMMGNSHRHGRAFINTTRDIDIGERGHRRGDSDDEGDDEVSEAGALSTTMEQELAQFRAAASVVGDMIAAEEGRSGGRTTTSTVGEREALRSQISAMRERDSHRGVVGEQQQQQQQVSEGRNGGFVIVPLHGVSTAATPPVPALPRDTGITVNLAQMPTMRPNPHHLYPAQQQHLAHNHTLGHHPQLRHQPTPSYLPAPPSSPTLVPRYPVIPSSTPVSGAPQYPHNQRQRRPSSPLSVRSAFAECGPEDAHLPTYEHVTATSMPYNGGASGVCGHAYRDMSTHIHAGMGMGNVNTSYPVHIGSVGNMGSGSSGAGTGNPYAFFGMPEHHTASAAGSGAGVESVENAEEDASAGMIADGMMFDRNNGGYVPQETVWGGRGTADEFGDAKP